MGNLMHRERVKPEGFEMRGNLSGLVIISYGVMSC